LDVFFEKAKTYLGIGADWFLEVFISTALIAVFAVLAYVVLKRILKKIFERFSTGEKAKIPARKAKTYNALLVSALKYVILFVALLEIFNRLGLGSTVSSLFATAGIGGLAIGIGAQDIITDILTGVFLLTEDQLGVGDYVTVEGFSGFVEAVKLRTTLIRDFSGALHIINNGAIRQVTNLSKRDSLALVEIPVPFEEDLKGAMATIGKGIRQGLQNNDSVMEPPQVLGITDVTQQGAVIRMVCLTKPLEHYGVERDMRLYALESLKSAGYKIGYPRTVLENIPTEQ